MIRTLLSAALMATPTQRQAGLTSARRDHAAAGTRSRPLCQYPLVAKYKGTGSTDDAANFVCSTGF